MEKAKSVKWLQYLAVIGTNIGLVCTGMHFGWSSNALPLLTSETSKTYDFVLNTTEASWLVSLAFLGEAMGSVLAVPCAKPLGRKKLVLLASPILAISWLLLALGPTKACLFIGRLLGGLMDGILFSVVPPYLNEIANADMRGFMGAINMTSFALGIATINWLVLLISLTAVSYLAAGGALFMLVIVPFLPESPQYLLWTKNVAGARKNLQKLRGQSNVEEELSRITKDLSNEGKSHRMVDILLKKQLRQCLMVLFILNWTANLCGPGAIQAYSKTMFESFDEGGFISASTANSVYFAVFFVASITSPLLVDRFGKKRLLIISGSLAIMPLLGNGVFLLVKSLGYDTSNVDYLEFVFILAYTIAHSMALYTLPVAVVAEIFPSDLKTVAMCILNVGFGVTNTVVVLMFNWTYYSFGGYVPFFMFASFLTVGLVFIVVVVPDIDRQSRKENSNNEEIDQVATFDASTKISVIKMSQ